MYTVQAQIGIRNLNVRRQIEKWEIYAVDF